jgi:hypothetical protein
MKVYFQPNMLSEADLTETQTAALVQVLNLLHSSLSCNEYAGLARNVKLVSLPGQFFTHNRLTIPKWQRTLIARPILYFSDFFFAVMIISLFYGFYRRFGSEAESNHFNITVKLA